MAFFVQLHFSLLSFPVHTACAYKNSSFGAILPVKEIEVNVDFASFMNEDDG